jgi:hypothetical protein
VRALSSIMGGIRIQCMCIPPLLDGIEKADYTMNCNHGQWGGEM